MKITLGPRASFCRNKAHKDKEPISKGSKAPKAPRAQKRRKQRKSAYDGNFLTPRPTRRHKEHRMDTTKANSFEKNGKHLGKFTRQPQKYETTLLGRQRTGSRLMCLRRGESKASQLKRHGKHIGKPTRKPKKYETNNTKIILGPRASFCRNKAHKDKEPISKGSKAPKAPRAQKRRKQSKST